MAKTKCEHKNITTILTLQFRITSRNSTCTCFQKVKLTLLVILTLGWTCYYFGTLSHRHLNYFRFGKTWALLAQKTLVLNTSLVELLYVVHRGLAKLRSLLLSHCVLWPLYLCDFIFPFVNIVILHALEYSQVSLDKITSKRVMLHLPYA